MSRRLQVAIIGFPNVGKSSLFNRLVGRRKALVHSLAGMTRDAVSAPVRVKGRTFLLTDTGGLFDSKDEPLSPQVRDKAWETARKADAVLFVLDGRRGLLPAEQELYLKLRKLDRPLLVAVNKVDTARREDEMGEFFRLGADRLFLVSAEHSRNIDDLAEALAAALPGSAGTETDGQSEGEGEGEGEVEEEGAALRLALIGRINVGKSSLANRLCGEERLIVSGAPGTTRDSSDVLIRREGKPFCLVDTAGLRKLGRARDVREKAGIIKSKKSIERADVVCLVMDALECPTRQDTAVAHIAHESGRPLVLAVNKWDLVPKERGTAEAFEDMVYSKLDFVSYAPLVFVSALTGQRVVKILELAEGAYANAGRRIETSKLNAFLARVQVDHPPVSVTKRRMKIKYMTQKSIRPPAFVMFGHSAERLAPAYERLFLGLLREEFGLWGTPLRVFVRSS